MGGLFSKKKDGSSITTSAADSTQDLSTQEIDVDDPEYIYLEATKRKLYEHLPNIKVKPLPSANRIALLQGPSKREEQEEQDGTKDPEESAEEKERRKYSDFAYGKTISTYPWDNNNGRKEKQGSPVCDRFSVALCETRTMIVMADGCNWGLRPREAALRAISAYVDYVTANHASIKDLKDAARLMLHGFSRAHRKISEGKDDIFEAGTTTLLAGILLQVEDPVGWAFVTITVGDCKAFHYETAKHTIMDITFGNRLNVTDGRDPGGRLGPYLDRGAPDLRNLKVYYEPCAENDLLLVMSDGLHDNFDPQQIGLKPSEVGATGDSWETLNKEEAESAKSDFRCKQLMKTMFTQNDGTRTELKAKEVLEQYSAPAPPKPDAALLQPGTITDNLLHHCLRLTQSSRDFMETNPNKPLPHNYQLYPGKMDHTTCVVMKVTPVKPL